MIKNFCFCYKDNVNIPRFDDYLEMLTDEEVKDFVAIIFSEYFKSIEEEQNV